jgi:glycosyltransferase involved in cell wall biosynthesis
VLPVSIDVRSYPYESRSAAPGETVNIMSVGRFVEKKGFDDIIRAMSLVKERTQDPFKVFLIGGGPEELKLKELVSAKGLQDCVEFKGPMPVERIIESFMSMHLFVQPSKTAADGDME